LIRRIFTRSVRPFGHPRGAAGPRGA
jgi:hypothetical protein